MSFFSSFKGFFSSFSSHIKKALDAAGGNGLSDALVAQALSFIKLAATRFASNQEKREWVTKELMKRGIPESISRLAVELAYQLFQKEIGKIPEVPPIQTVSI